MVAKYRKTRIEGARELERVLLKLPSVLQERIMVGALRDAAKPIKEDAERLAPRDQGDLAENILIRKARKGTGIGGVSVLIGPARRAFQGLFQEFGTIRHAAQPFMRPAFDGNVKKSLEILGKRLWERIEKQAVKLAGAFRSSGLARRRRRRR